LDELPFGNVLKGNTEFSFGILLLLSQKVKKANASNPPMTPPTIAPASFACEPADCWGGYDAAVETGPELCDEVEVKLGAVVVKTRLGIEARLANEGV